MLDNFGDRQRELLRTLHNNKSGMTIDELAAQLDITRTAVKQHLVALEQNGYIERGSLRVVTRGRPGRAFRLTERGVDLFPKQYSWFSSLLLGSMVTEQGSESVGKKLRGLAAQIAQLMQSRVQGKTGQARADEVVKIMNELSYEAEALAPLEKAGLPGIKANNCVYHHLAREYPEVCEFDLEILAKLMDASVDHQECIVRGGNSCRFAFTKR